ncbi:MAG: hypothetical protein NVS4B7_00090 [Ktedonobacteraceae bacterium]
MKKIEQEVRISPPSQSLLLSELEHDLVNITPTPICSCLKGLNKRMVGGMEMFGGVLIFRGVTATNVATNQTLA